MCRWLMFTYGTLKRGEPNHGVLTAAENGAAEFVGEAETASAYPLLIASRYNIPFLLDKQGTGHKVKGELYSVDETMLKAMDALESHPDFYVRREEEVVKLEGGEVVRPWIYFLPQWKEAMLERPLLREYRSAGDHGLAYVPRYNRDAHKRPKDEVYP